MGSGVYGVGFGVLRFLGLGKVGFGFRVQGLKSRFLGNLAPPIRSLPPPSNTRSHHPLYAAPTATWFRVGLGFWTEG